MPSLGGLLGGESVGCLTIGSRYEFSSSNNPNRSFRHRDQEIHVDVKTEDENHVADRTWKIVKGLTGESDTISFQSENFAHWHLRHAGYVCWAHETEDADLYQMDSTFRVHEDGNYVRFQSVNYPDHYLRIDEGNDFRV